jgi:endonuclease-3
MALSKADVKRIRETLRSIYPRVKPALNFETPFELLVATVLSAQCTDERVNAVTKELFAILKTPADFADAPLEQIEALIRPTGFFRNKAKSLKNCSKALVEKYDGTVPGTMAELVNLPGVGRKTANVMLGGAFGIPGIVVDTHVARISQRLGLTENKDPVKIEFDLMQKIPEAEWSDFSLRLIFFGRETCTARNPKCDGCPLKDLCCCQ